MTQPPSGGSTPQHAAATGGRQPAATGQPTRAARSPRSRRGLVVVSVVLVATLLLCGGGGAAAFFALRNAENGEGAEEPAVAVESFLSAVYQDRDPAQAAELVCSDARDDEKIAAKVAEVQAYAARYRNPRFRWSSPSVDSQNGERATVSTKLTMTTADEKVAEQNLRFTVVRKAGWWVCEVG